MPGNPDECRQHALHCADLAHTARTPELKSTLIELSKNWHKLAIELEGARELLDMQDPRPSFAQKHSTSRWRLSR
jgi:hypothetical protein